MKLLHNAMILVGILLILFGHANWIASPLKPTFKMNCIMMVIPGWALLTMGYIGAKFDTLNKNK